jgi:hypothetical protein
MDGAIGRVRRAAELVHASGPGVARHRRPAVLVEARAAARTGPFDHFLGTRSRRLCAPGNSDNGHGVNPNNFDPALLAQVNVRRFDGADTWTFLDEGAA